MMTTDANAVHRHQGHIRPARDGTPRQGAGATGRVEADPSSLSLVEIAQYLEGVTAQIESERAREREARAAYKQVAEQVEARIVSIREQAASLVREQQRRMSSFDGMFAPAAGLDGASDDPRHASGARRHSPLATPANLGEAIVALWTLPEHTTPLSTEEIAEALPSVGYESKAAPRSLRSAVNQALAKLSRDGRIEKYRQDGTMIRRDDTHSRARRYMPTP